MTWFWHPHHHKWWLVNMEVYAPRDNPLSELTYTMLTFVCRDNRSHLKQQRLQGKQVATADAVYERQRKDQGLEDIPGAFTKAWNEKGEV